MLNNHLTTHTCFGLMLNKQVFSQNSIEQGHPYPASMHCDPHPTVWLINPVQCNIPLNQDSFSLPDACWLTLYIYHIHTPHIHQGVGTCVSKCTCWDIRQSSNELGLAVVNSKSRKQTPGTGPSKCDHKMYQHALAYLGSLGCTSSSPLLCYWDHKLVFQTVFKLQILVAILDTSLGRPGLSEASAPLGIWCSDGPTLGIPCAGCCKRLS